MLKDHLKWLEDTGFDKIKFSNAPVPMRYDGAALIPAAGWKTTTNPAPAMTTVLGPVQWLRLLPGR